MFGLIGFVVKIYDYNIVPIVLGMILGKIAEQGLQQALILYDDDLGAVFSSFLGRPICIGLLLLMAVSVCAPMIMEARAKNSMN